MRLTRRGCLPHWSSRFGRRCGGDEFPEFSGESDKKRSPWSRRNSGLGNARDRPLADAGVVFLPVRKTPGRRCGTVSSTGHCGSNVCWAVSGCSDRNIQSCPGFCPQSCPGFCPQRVGEAASLVPGGSPICHSQGDLEGIGRSALLALQVKDAQA